MLAAKHIPCRQATSPHGPLRALFVPPLYTDQALGEILAFEAERPERPLPQPPDKGGAVWIVLFFSALLLWQLFCWNGSEFFSSVAPYDEWVDLGGLDVYRTRNLGEWWRAFTALTLHADTSHLLGNIASGSVFMIPLCRRTGPGLCLLFTILAGGLGNMATLLFRPASSVSLGFSTALFGAVGLLAAFMAVYAFLHTLAVLRLSWPLSLPLSPRGRERGRAAKNAAFQAMLPLGTGLGVLAMLGGSSAPGVSYLSHVMGLAAGLILGVPLTLCALRLRLPRKKEAALQGGALLLTGMLLAGSWGLALSG